MRTVKRVRILFMVVSASGLEIESQAKGKSAPVEIEFRCKVQSGPVIQ